MSTITWYRVAPVDHLDNYIPTQREEYATWLKAQLEKRHDRPYAIGSTNGSAWTLTNVNNTILRLEFNAA